MFRPPKVFSPETAHEFLENHNNIIWCPYSSRNLTGVDQLQRSFAISIRRGMLPWRFSAESTDLCAAEPYHPDRVARQFKLDQQVPYNPLQSLLTETDVGVAYAYWSHLLCPVQEVIQHALGTNYVGSASLAWTNWWRKFAHPHSTILNSLKSGNMCGKIQYDERKSMCAKRGKKFYPTRTLSEDDLFIIKEVLVNHQKAYIEKIEAEEKAFADHWNPILYDFLSDDEPSMEPRRKRKKMDNVECPSPDPSLHELGEDDALVSTCEDVRPLTKKKVDTLNEESDSSPIRLDGPIHVSDLGSVDLDGILSGEVDHGLGDLANLNVDDYGISSSGLDPPPPLFHKVWTQTCLRALMF
ncbi:uncharacterized protein [Triticum aestivum]|uniref:uncharacterized protein n=1 Tax=Triticum aestivum TaxID=4565 RepID=UPI001D01D7BE|nr:uncharacterized protein LOC123094339 [Triticum aestivum]